MQKHSNDPRTALVQMDGGGQRALKAAKSDYYRELAANCRRAMEEELSWSRQFDRLVPLVERRLAHLAGKPAAQPA